MTEILRNNLWGVPVSTIVMPYGLTVVCAEFSTSFVNAEIVMNAGSLDDDAHPGVSHYVEHLLFEGPTRTGVHPKFRELALDGARGGASTCDSHTRYWVEGMDSELRALLAALFSIAFGGKFSHEAMEKERGIILAEIENGGYNGGYQTWLEKLLYPTLPLMHCSAAGTEESVGAISLTDIEAHFHRHYRPKNAILIVKSRFPAELVFAAAAAAMPDFRAFGRGPRLTRGCIFPNVVEETYKSPQTTERLLWVFRRQPDSHIDRKFGLALDVLCSSPFGGVFASLRNRQSLIYSTSEISRGFPVASTEMVILANQTKFKAIEMAFQQEVEKIISGRIGQEALRCVLGRRRRYYIERRENPDGLMCNLRYQWLEDGRIYDSSDGEKAVLSTTLEDVAEAAAQFMVPGNFSLIRHMRT